MSIHYSKFLILSSVYRAVPRGGGGGVRGQFSALPQRSDKVTQYNALIFVMSIISASPPPLEIRETISALPPAKKILGTVLAYILPIKLSGNKKCCCCCCCLFYINPNSQTPNPVSTASKENCTSNMNFRGPWCL